MANKRQNVACCLFVASWWLLDFLKKTFALCNVFCHRLHENAINSWNYAGRPELWLEGCINENVNKSASNLHCKDFLQPTTNNIQKLIISIPVKKIIKGYKKSNVDQPISWEICHKSFLFLAEQKFSTMWNTVSVRIKFSTEMFADASIHQFAAAETKMKHCLVSYQAKPLVTPCPQVKSEVGEAFLPSFSPQ